MNFNLLISFFLCLFLNETIHSQELQGIFEGELIVGNYGARSVKTISNDGYIMMGTMETLMPEEKTQVYVVRVSDSLEMLWSKAIEVEGNDRGNAVALTEDGGFLLVGTSTSSIDLKKSIYIIKLSDQGEIEWSKLVESKNYQLEGNAVKVCEDGSFVIVGSSGISEEDTDVYIVKLTNNGDIIWDKNIGGGGIDTGYAVNTDADGGFIIAGETNSFDSNHNYVDSYFIKLDETGNLQWTNLLFPYVPSRAHDITPTTDGGYAAVGRFGGSGYIAKMNSEGDVQWLKEYGLSDYSSYFYKISTLENGNVVAVGNAGRVSGLLVESTIDGDYIKGREYWGQEAYKFYGADLADDGGMILVGSKKQRNANIYERLYFIKTDAGYSTCIAPLLRYRADSHNFAEGRSGGVLNEGDSTISDVISLEEMGKEIISVCSNILNVADFPKQDKLLIYPNPTKDIFTIESDSLIFRVDISTPDGKIILSSEIQNFSTTVSMKHFSAGIYMVTIYSQTGTSTKRVVLSK
ncbi:MAG: T9SS type A sorting domain-containing protein [Aequorivita sp.]